MRVTPPLLVASFSCGIWSHYPAAGSSATQRERPPWDCAMLALTLTMCPGLHVAHGRQQPRRSVIRLRRDDGLRERHSSSRERAASQEQQSALPPRRRVLCAAAGLVLAAGPASRATASQAVGSVVQHGQSAGSASCAGRLSGPETSALAARLPKTGCGGALEPARNRRVHCV